MVQGATIEPGATVQQLPAEMVFHDETLLERSRTQWQFGDWNSLAKVNPNRLQHHPDRAKLALLNAAALLQLGATDEARQSLNLARDWGCGKELIGRILIAGVHNSLGRAAIASGQNQRAQKHFEVSIATVTPKADVALLGQGRQIRESTQLGLLPEAAALLGKQLQDAKQTKRVEKSRLSILETELELINHELSLAQIRQQLPSQMRRNNNESLVVGSPAWLAELKNKSVSQLGQDLWVLEKTNYKHGGFFVEFGATDGVLLSNTWLLEKEFGWNGLCAEPNPKLFFKLKQNRRCIVSDACIAGESGKKVEFVMADAYGGILDYAKADNHADKREAYQQAECVTTLSTTTLDDFLRQHNAPRDIDYLSVDTEGSEFEILQAFPFDQWKIKLLTIEHNYTSRRTDIRDLMERHGYLCTERDFDDWYEKIEN
jgi:FkbM family methyltransferase